MNFRSMYRGMPQPQVVVADWPYAERCQASRKLVSRHRMSSWEVGWHYGALHAIVVAHLQSDGELPQGMRSCAYTQDDYAVMLTRVAVLLVERPYLQPSPGMLEDMTHRSEVGISWIAYMLQVNQKIEEASRAQAVSLRPWV